MGYEKQESESSDTLMSLYLSMPSIAAEQGSTVMEVNISDLVQQVKAETRTTEPITSVAQSLH